MTADAASMVADLRRWSADLALSDASTAGIAAAVAGSGSVDGADGSGPQLDLRPDRPGWLEATVVRGTDGPAHVRLVVVEDAELTVQDLEDAFGPVVTTPPRVHFTDPEQRIYDADTGAPNFTTALIAELAPDSGTLQAVILRRDVRLE